MSDSETALAELVVQGLGQEVGVVSYFRHLVVSECFVPWTASVVKMA